MKNKLRGNLMLMATALIWGTAFVAQKSGMDLLGEMMSFREIIGCIIMFAAIFVANLPEDAFKHSKD